MSRLTGSSIATLKLDELIAVTSGASDRAIGMERSKEAEIDAMRRELEEQVAIATDEDP